jgi:hypothetical protein
MSMDSTEHICNLLLEFHREANKRQAIPMLDATDRILDMEQEGSGPTVRVAEGDHKTLDFTRKIP